VEKLQRKTEENLKFNINLKNQFFSSFFFFGWRNIIFKHDSPSLAVVSSLALFGCCPFPPSLIRRLLLVLLFPTPISRKLEHHCIIFVFNELFLSLIDEYP
jgi:hypothetical protein